MTANNDRQVIISDARYTDGAANSTVYHRIENNCLRGGKQTLRLEVSEEIAKAFGRTFCKVCAEAQWKEALANNLQNVPELDKLVDALPTGFEIRILHSGKKVWSNLDGKKRTKGPKVDVSPEGESSST